MIRKHKSDRIYDQKVVSLGGGTGHFTWLRGAVKRNNPENITAIPATWDSGGSSGRLRVKEGVLPPGDYMQCLLALMESDDQLQEAIKILRDRSGGDPLVNLLATKAEKVHHSVERGIDGLRKLFIVMGKIIPVSLDDLDINTKTKYGRVIEKEDQIDSKKNEANFKLEDEISRTYFDTEAEVNPKALKAIQEADKIVIPPGSPYTSIFPHLHVTGIPQAIKSSKAELILTLNLMTTGGEDHHLYLASRWLRVYQYYLEDNEWIKQHGISRINYLIVNENHIDEEILEIYDTQGQKRVVVDEQECMKAAPGLKIVSRDLASYDKYSHLLRHDPLRLAEAVLSL